MIDSLLGMALLLMLSGWMASLVSVQTMLSSPARNVSQREQIDFLAAVKQKSGSSVLCPDLIREAKSKTNLEALQDLLVASAMLQRPEGVSSVQLKDQMRAEGQLPLTTQQQGAWILDGTNLLQVSAEDQMGSLLYDSKAPGGADWFLRLSDPDASGNLKRQQLFVC